MQNPTEETFVSHLIELRDRLLKSLIAVAIVLVALLPFMKEIYYGLAEPLINLAPQGMIATGMTGPFFAQMKATAAVAFMIALPVVLYQMWAFVAPGLYRRERRIVLPLVVSTYVLFLVGVAFAYFLVIPNVTKFMLALNPDPGSMTFMPDMEAYLSFAFTMFIAFGFAFEVPVVVIILVYAGMVTVDKLVEYRPYLIVGAFVVAAVITPPDMISQVMLAVPMCILYEVGLFFARRIRPGDAEDMDTLNLPQTDDI